MSKWLDINIYEADPNVTLGALASSLQRGELAFLLGSGVSSAFGLPNWTKLIQNCLTDVGGDPSKVSATASFEELTTFAGEIRAKVGTELAIIDCVKRSLYPADHEKQRVNPSSLLLAIGAMMMSSRRGSIRQAWTLNYDDVLEWYLRIHGFVSQVVITTPCLMRDSDVTIYHPHGFIPFDDKHGPSSAKIILDDVSYAERSLKNDEAWRSAFQTFIRSKILLVIGMSWTDLLVKNLFVEASSAVTDRPLAFWFYKGAVGDAQAIQLKRFNIVPVPVLDHSHLPPYLLKICENARASLAPTS